MENIFAQIDEFKNYNVYDHFGIALGVSYKYSIWF